MRRLSRPLPHWRGNPHDHLPTERGKRTQVHHFRYDVRLLHVKDRDDDNADCMGRQPPQCPHSHCGQHLCRCRSGATLRDQPPLCPTNNQSLTSQLRLASHLPLHFHKHICHHRAQPTRPHHLRHPELLHPQPQHKTHRP